jgi:hypothetical protein
MTSFDWNSLIQTFAVALIPIVVGAFGVWLRQHMQDQAAAAAITQALGNALGAMQQAVQKGITNGAVKQAGVDYVKAVVPEALARDPAANTDALIGEKLDARLGVANIQANLATAASPAPSPKPLDPVLANNQGTSP